MQPGIQEWIEQKLKELISVICVKQKWTTKAPAWIFANAIHLAKVNFWIFVLNAVKGLKMNNIKLNVAVEIKWVNRYSSTMEDDKQGRWARVAYAGRFNGFGFYRKKVSLWEIARVKKCMDKFTVHSQGPTVMVGIYDTVEQAKEAAEKDFRWFIEMCVNN